MDRLPVELWAKIFLKLRRRIDWLALSRACRVFRLLAEAEIYRTIYLSRVPDIGYSLSENRKTTLFARSVIGRPDLAVLVRTIALGHPSPELGGVSESFSSNPILCQIALFSGLRTLLLSNLHVDAELCSALHSLPCLSTVELAECEVDPALAGSEGNPAPEIGLLDLSIVLPRSARGWTAVACAGLRSLLIDYQAMNPDDDLLEIMIAEFVQSQQTHTLTTLRFTQDVPSNIISCLTSSPRLVHISISRVALADSHHPVHSLPADTIPLLEHFSGPAEYSANFIRGRPVHKADLLMPSEPSKDMLHSLRLSSVPVTQLLVHGNTWHVENFQQAPITLQRLRWTLEVHKEDLMSLIPTLSRMPNLRVLESIVYPMSHSDQKDITYAISDACPSVQDFFFGVRFGEDDRWCRSNNGVWEHYTVCS